MRAFVDLILYRFAWQSAILSKFILILELLISFGALWLVPTTCLFNASTIPPMVQQFQLVSPEQTE